MFIVSLTYQCDLDAIDAALPAHVQWLKNAYANGQLIASGRKIPRTGGVLLSKLTSRDELDALLAADPFYQQQLARYEVIEFEASMVAAGYEVLQ
ncbi:YciI family protein [Gallaecimonas sp. GXIMD1310]|uniref:YciI family protein n=1 Tax=Gallaecimonas sp. GXIMD1310 TaxID=3131926 RepID=UPI003254347B